MIVWIYIRRNLSLRNNVRMWTVRMYSHRASALTTSVSISSFTPFICISVKIQIAPEQIQKLQRWLSVWTQRNRSAGNCRLLHYDVFPSQTYLHLQARSTSVVRITTIRNKMRKILSRTLAISLHSVICVPCTPSRNVKIIDNSSGGYKILFKWCHPKSRGEGWK